MDFYFCYLDDHYEYNFNSERLAVRLFFSEMVGFPSATPDPWRGIGAQEYRGTICTLVEIKTLLDLRRTKQLQLLRVPLCEFPLWPLWFGFSNAPTATPEGKSTRNFHFGFCLSSGLLRRSPPDRSSRLPTLYIPNRLFSSRSILFTMNEKSSILSTKSRWLTSMVNSLPSL